MFEEAPHRPVITLHNYCGSYGMLKHMEPNRIKYREQGGGELDYWQLYSISNSGEYEGGIPGLFGIFCKELSVLEDRSIPISSFFEHVNAIYRARNPSFREKPAGTTDHAHPCIKCISFNAPNPDTLGLCSVCYKSHMAVPAQEREDIVEMRRVAEVRIAQEALEDGAQGSDQVEACALRAMQGDPDTGNLPMGLLLPPPAGQAAL